MKEPLKLFSKAIAIVLIISVITVIAFAYTNFTTLPTSKLVFTTGHNQIVEINQRSSAITIQRQDSSGHPVVSGNLIINLFSTSKTGKFYASLSSNIPITELTIPNADSSTSVYFSDTEIGTPTLKASSEGYTSTNTTLSLRPSQYIAISYSYKITESIVDKNRDLRVPDSDSVYLVVNMTITNKGYNAPFPTHSENFNPLANGKQDFRYITYLSLSNWNWTLGLHNGESYSGQIVFQVPKSLSAASFSMNFKTTQANPYIIWSKT